MAITIRQTSDGKPDSPLLKGELGYDITTNELYIGTGEGYANGSMDTNLTGEVSITRGTDLNGVISSTFTVNGGCTGRPNDFTRSYDKSYTVIDNQDTLIINNHLVKVNTNELVFPPAPFSGDTSAGLTDTSCVITEETLSSAVSKGDLIVKYIDDNADMYQALEDLPIGTEVTPVVNKIRHFNGVLVRQSMVINKIHKNTYKHHREAIKCLKIYTEKEQQDSSIIMSDIFGSSVGDSIALWEDDEYFITLAAFLSVEYNGLAYHEYKNPFGTYEFNDGKIGLLTSTTVDSVYDCYINRDTDSKVFFRTHLDKLVNQQLAPVQISSKLVKEDDLVKDFRNGIESGKRVFKGLSFSRLKDTNAKNIIDGICFNGSGPYIEYFYCSADKTKVLERKEVGGSSYTIKSTDDGETWSHATFDSDFGVNSIYNIDADEGDRIIHMYQAYQPTLSNKISSSTISFKDTVVITNTTKQMSHGGSAAAELGLFFDTVESEEHSTLFVSAGRIIDHYLRTSPTEFMRMYYLTQTESGQYIGNMVYTTSTSGSGVLDMGSGRVKSVLLPYYSKQI